MYELIPILVGAAVGLGVTKLDGWRARVLAIAPSSVVVGIAAAVLSGEIAESWAFVLWDTAQAFAAATLANVIAIRFIAQRRRDTRLGD